MGKSTDPRFTPADAVIVKSKASGILGRFGFRISDRDDLEQDLAMHVFQQTHRHQPERGSREKFISKIAKNKLLNLIEQRTAQKRDDRRDIRINDASEGVLLDGSGTPGQIDLAIDVREVIARLPDDLQQVALLRHQYSEKELEGLLQLTRAQVRSRLQRLEGIFRKAGLAPNSDR